MRGGPRRRTIAAGTPRARGFTVAPGAACWGGQIMDDRTFDALARFVAAPRTRRQLVRAFGGSLLAGLVSSRRAGAAACPSGVVCSDRCCPDASDICLGGQCTSCPSGVVCSDRCCAVGESCQDGACTATAVPEPSGPCPPGSRECDGVCYPGGCCTDADCGPCLTCGADHVCRGCDAARCQTCGGTGTCVSSCTAGQVCQNGSCCTPAACQPGQCGRVPDACGGPLDCGNCPAGQCLICAGGTCVQACPAPQVCHDGLCCTPKTCQAGQCGRVPDGCGGTLTCDDCPPGQTCHQGSCCTPTTCR